MLKNKMNNFGGKISRQNDRHLAHGILTIQNVINSAPDCDVIVDGTYRRESEEGPSQGKGRERRGNSREGEV